MIKLPLSFEIWNKLKNVLEFSWSNIKISYIGDSALRWRGCINEIFNQICSEEVSRIQKTRLEWNLYAKHLKDVSLTGWLYWLTGISVVFQSYSMALQKEKI